MLEGVILRVVGDSIDPGGLAYSSFSKYKNIEILFSSIQLLKRFKNQTALN